MGVESPPSCSGVWPSMGRNGVAKLRAKMEAVAISFRNEKERDRGILSGSSVPWHVCTSETSGGLLSAYIMCRLG